MTETCTATPPEQPLAMPTQVFSRHPGARVSTQDPVPLLARWITFGGALVLTVFASRQMALVLPLDQGTAEAWGASSPWMIAALWLLLGLFTVTFGWVALTAMAAVAGLVCGQDRRRAAANTPLRGRTVLLMPVYHEDPVSACAALAAMADELAAMKLAEHFEIFILSDSSDPRTLAAEAATADCLRERLAGVMPVWYRYRGRNTARKAGNIREFVSRWGDRYDYMVVLDADSLIAGETLATLVREMDADPGTGILQTLPRLHGGRSLYARLQQFAATVYGPVFARGLNAWQGHDGNYWGHNAIIRVRAFAESAGLPSMPGPRPFGGEIRSHDFVEAALIRRAGWAVRMLPGLSGSWEECPPTLLDAAVRDRRWAQGNVQHLGVISARGLRWPNRAHMLMGVMNYLTSPLWLAMVMVGLALSTQLSQGPLADGSGADWWSFDSLVFDARRMIQLFFLTMALLLLPKLVGIVRGLLNEELHRGPGRLRMLLSAVLELVFSVLHAPIVMMLHSRHMWEIVRGQDSGWSAQQRRGHAVPWRQLLHRHGGQMAAGLLAMAMLTWMSSPLLYWMLPMIIGLVLAIPLSALSGSLSVGGMLHRYRLLTTPEEHEPPVILLRRRQAEQSLRGSLPAGFPVAQSGADASPAPDGPQEF